MQYFLQGMDITLFLGTGNAELIASCPFIATCNKNHNAKSSRFVRMDVICIANFVRITLILALIVNAYKNIDCFNDTPD